MIAFPPSSLGGRGDTWASSGRVVGQAKANPRQIEEIKEIDEDVFEHGALVKQGIASPGTNNGSFVHRSDAII